MSKRECEWYRNLFILFGAVSIGLGVTMPFRSGLGGAWQIVLAVVCTVALIVLGLMQFRLAAALHARAQKAKE